MTPATKMQIQALPSDLRAKAKASTAKIGIAQLTRGLFCALTVVPLGVL